MKTWIFVFLGLWLGLSTAASGNEKKRVLVLNSYHHGHDWTDHQVKGIQDAFASDDDVILHIEYMDSEMINDSQHYSLLANIYERKYAGLRFDALIVTDDDALDFMTRYRDEYFPSTPLVFSGINDFDVSKMKGLDAFTGVNERIDFAKNLSLIEQLFPKTNNIVVVSDDSSSNAPFKRQFKQAAASFESRFRFTYLQSSSIDALLQQASRLQKGQVIFYLSFQAKENGSHLENHDILPQLANAAMVPIFGATDDMIDQGIIGGLLKSGYSQGKHAAELAQQILSGLSVKDLPVLMETPHAYTFDYHQLERFGLSFDDLPSETQLINEPQTFYYRNKTIIWVTIATLAALLFFIVILLINIRQRARVQQGLQSILETSQTLFDVSLPQQFKLDLLASLSKMLPDAKRISLIRYKGENKQFDEKQLAVINAGQQEHTTNVNASAKKLISDAIKNKTSAYQNNEAVVPLDCENSPVNWVYVDGKRKLDRTDQQLFELFAGNVSLSIEHAENFKLSNALQTAQRIQHAMLPTSFADISMAYQIDLHAFVVPAKEVGGDLYDFFALDDDHLCVCVGDVSDKGVPAAIFMAMAKTVLRATATIDLSPAEILYRTNNELSNNNPETMFVTLFLLIFNRKTGYLQFANGGHNLPYLLKANGQIQVIECQSGTALGVFEGLTYDNGELQLQAGDGLLIYSDGITEAANDDQQLYGDERLIEVLRQSPQASATELNRLILQSIREFADTAAQSDDITSLFLRVKEPLIKS